MCVHIQKASTNFIMSVQLSVLTYQLGVSPNGFLWNLILETFMKIFQDTQNIVTKIHKYLEVYMKTQSCFIVAGNIKLPLQHCF
jgi:hypothetical protein